MPRGVLGAKAKHPARVTPLSTVLQQHCGASGSDSAGQHVTVPAILPQHRSAGVPRREASHAGTPRNTMAGRQASVGHGLSTDSVTITIWRPGGSPFPRPSWQPQPGETELLLLQMPPRGAPRTTEQWREARCWGTAGLCLNRRQDSPNFQRGKSGKQKNQNSGERRLWLWLSSACGGQTDAFSNFTNQHFHVLISRVSCFIFHNHK